jgi:hypothetical protein
MSEFDDTEIFFNELAADIEVCRILTQTVLIQFLASADPAHRQIIFDGVSRYMLAAIDKIERASQDVERHKQLTRARAERTLQEMADSLGLKKASGGPAGKAN